MPLAIAWQDENLSNQVKPELQTHVRLGVELSLALTYEKDANGTWWLENHISDPDPNPPKDASPYVKYTVGRQRVKVEDRAFIRWLELHRPWDEQGTVGRTSSEVFAVFEPKDQVVSDNILRSLASLIR